MKIQNLLCFFTIISKLNPQLAAGTVVNLDLFIRKMEAEVLKAQPKCTDLVTTIEISLDLSRSANSTNASGNTEKPRTRFSHSLSTNTTESVASWSPAAILHYKPCSLLLFNISAILRQADNASMDYDNWPTVPYAGSVHSSYHFFFVDFYDRGANPDSQELLLSFAKATRKLPNTFFALIQPDGQLEIFARTAFADKLLLKSTYSHTGSLSQHGRSFLASRLDFQGLPMIATVCVICDKSMERFEHTGEWNDYLTATMYQLASYANATLEPTAIFGAPRTGLTLDGDWDEFVMPLLDGSGVITQLLEPSDYNRKFLFSSSPIYFDNVAFITARPTRLRFTSLARLAAPLRINVWVGIGISFVLVFIALEVIFQVYGKLEFKRRSK